MARVITAIVDARPLYSVGSIPRVGPLVQRHLRTVRVEQGRLEWVFANPLAGGAGSKPPP